MKHLKPFFESNGWNDINVGEVKDFINNSHLAYLVDEGFVIDISSRIDNSLPFSPFVVNTNDQNFSSSTVIKIYKKERGSKVNFNWNDIKDNFISFIEMFIRRYDLPRLKLDFGVDAHGVSGTMTYMLSDITEDRVKSDWQIKYIIIKRF
jgi:hypothetical protein